MSYGEWGEWCQLCSKPQVDCLASCVKHLRIWQHACVAAGFKECTKLNSTNWLEEHAAHLQWQGLRSSFRLAPSCKLVKEYVLESHLPHL